MARYIVALWLSHNRACRVTCEVTRKDDVRAIAFAEKWLHRSRISTRAIWVGYDRWTLVEKVDADTLRLVGNGVLGESPAYRAGYKRPKAPPKKRVPSVFEANGFIFPTAGKRRKALTPLQLKMIELRNSAVERLNNGARIPRVGGNPHGKE